MQTEKDYPRPGRSDWNNHGSPISSILYRRKRIPKTDFYTVCSETGNWT